MSKPVLKPMLTISACMAALLVLCFVPGARAQDMRDLVAAALDEKITERIEIGQQRIREALVELEPRTGLRFRLSPQALQWMPYGEETRIAIVLDDISVRAGLRRIFDGLGLMMRVEDDAVAIEPAAWLDRLGRRLTIDEVGVLQKLSQRSWGAISREELAVEFRLPADVPAGELLEKTIADVGGGNALTQLEAATLRLGWAWIPSGKGILVYSRDESVHQRLDRPLDFNYRRIPIDKLLLDLGRRIDVTMHFEPGVLEEVSASERRVDLIQRGITPRQVLELICGQTGLWYEVVENGLIIGGPGTDEGVAREAGRGSPVVAIIEIPVGEDGTKVHLLIRADELPPELSALRDQKLPEIIEKLRAELD